MVLRQGCDTSAFLDEFADFGALRTMLRSAFAFEGLGEFFQKVFQFDRLEQIAGNPQFFAADEVIRPVA